jgi:hypothetical protein
VVVDEFPNENGAGAVDVDVAVVLVGFPKLNLGAAELAPVVAAGVAEGAPKLKGLLAA